MCAQTLQKAQFLFVQFDEGLSLLCRLHIKMRCFLPRFSVIFYNWAFFAVFSSLSRGAAAVTTGAVSAPRPHAAAALPTVVACPGTAASLRARAASRQAPLPGRLPLPAPGRFPQVALPGHPSQPQEQLRRPALRSRIILRRISATIITRIAATTIVPMLSVSHAMINASLVFFP